MRSKAALPKERLVFANVMLRSASGNSVFDAGREITPRNVREFLPDKTSLDEGQRLLAQLGFRVDLVTETHISISGPMELYERLFRVQLERRFVPVFAGLKGGPRRPYFVPVSPVRIARAHSQLIEAVTFPVPLTYLATPVRASPPTLGYDHLEVPHDVARAMDALKVHSRGITGAGIRLAIVDSGFMTRTPPLPKFHAYYAGKNYNIQAVVPAPGDDNSGDDQSGHGTAIAACALAVAPGVTFTMFKEDNGDPTRIFPIAAQQNPHIISCSWFVSTDDPLTAPSRAALQASINLAVSQGIVVVFACGNIVDDQGNAPVQWPGSEPAVISVGGAFIDGRDALQASSYATSGTNHNMNPGRQVPDLCGIVGMAPKGIFIALPTQPGSDLDSGYSGPPYPTFDTTGDSDGWAVFSGTSSAAPMIAGVAALIMEANQAAIRNPALVRSLLNASCVDVTSGASASGQFAGPGQDLATGWGLAQAYRATNGTDVWVKDNPISDIGLIPSHNRRPHWPPYGHWTSPDIKVFSTPLANPGADFDPTPASDPIFGQDNYVYIRIRNRGTRAAGPVDVRFYYGEPAINLVFPNDWKDGQSGIAGQGAISVAGAATNLQVFPSVAPGDDNVLPQAFVWQLPNPSKATRGRARPDGTRAGRFCLLATLNSVDDPIIFAAGGQASVINDNNLAMRNEQLYISPPGRKCTFAFFIKGSAEKDHRVPTQLVFDLRALPPKSEAMLGLGRKQFPGLRLVNAAHAGKGIRLRPGGRLSAVTNLHLDATESVLAQFAVRLPAGTPVKDYAVSVAASAGGLSLGGITFVLRVRDTRGTVRVSKQ